jgi:dynein heavy chain
MNDFRADLSSVRLSEKDEAYILIHSLRDANLPKFLAEDVPLFESILDDLFPGITPPEPDHGILEVRFYYIFLNSQRGVPQIIFR